MIAGTAREEDASEDCNCDKNEQGNTVQAHSMSDWYSTNDRARGRKVSRSVSL
jgi:hypothetical protein